MPVLTGVETQKPDFSFTLVERLARREKEKSEGRSSLKARLRRWVGTSSSRRLEPNIDTQRELGSRELEASIDSGIGLDSSSSCLPAKEVEEQQMWTTVQPTPILRSSRSASLNSPKARNAVKKSISFSDGHGKSARWVRLKTLNQKSMILISNHKQIHSLKLIWNTINFFSSHNPWRWKCFFCYRKKSICDVKVWDVGFTSSVSATKTQMWLILKTSCQYIQNFRFIWEV